MIGIGIAFLILPLVIVGLRVWAKSLGRRSLGYDDYLIFVSLLCSIAACILQLVAAIMGELGQHQSLSPEGEIIPDDPKLLTYEKCKFGLLLVSLISLGCAKASLLFFYKSIFSTRAFRLTSQIMIVVVAAWTIAFFFSYLFICTPVTPFLEPYYGKKCVNVLPLYYTSCATDSLVDIIILCMPIPMVLKLKLPRKQKIAVLGMFFLGAIVCAISITRLVMVITTAAEYLYHPKDVTYYTAPVFFWTVIEISLSVVSACLPTLRPLWIHFKGATPSNANSVQLKSYSYGSRYPRRSLRNPNSGFDEPDEATLVNSTKVDTRIEAMDGRLHSPYENYHYNNHYNNQYSNGISVEQNIRQHVSKI